MDFRKSDIVKNFSHKDKKNIIDYISMVYMKESPLKHITDLKDRKKQAISKSGITDDKVIHELMFLKNDKFRNLIYYCLSESNPMKFTKLIADMELFYQLQDRIMSPTSDDDVDKELAEFKIRSALSKDSDELLSRIQKNIKDVFPNQEEVEMIESTIKIKTADQRVQRMSK